MDKILSALPEDLVSAPTPTWQLTTIFNPSSKGIWHPFLASPSTAQTYVQVK